MGCLVGPHVSSADLDNGNGIRCGLRVQNAINGGNQPDEIINRAIAFLRGHLFIATAELQLIKDGVLAFFLPAKQPQHSF